MDKDLLKYYKKRHRGGRSVAARAMDGVFLGVVFAIASYLWFRSNVGNQVAAVVLAAVTTVLFLLAAALWRGISFERFVIKERERLRDEALRERLLLMPEEEFEKVLAAVRTEQEAQGRVIVALRQAEPVGQDGLLSAYRQAIKTNPRELLLCATAPFTKDAEALARRMPTATALMGPETLTRLARQREDIKVSDAAVEDRIRSILQQGNRKSDLQAQPFAPGRAGRYLICALLLFGGSFLTGYPLYYRLLASLCALLSAAAFFVNPRGESAARSHTNSNP